MLPISIRHGIPFLIVVFTAVLAAYTVQKEWGAAEAIVRGEAVLGMINRVTQLQKQFSYAFSNSDHERIAQEMSLLGSAPERQIAIMADDTAVVLGATNRQWVGRSLAEIAQVQWPPEPLEAIINRVREEFAGELVVAGRYVLGIYPVKLGAHAGSLPPERVGVLLVQRDLSRQLTHARRTIGQHTVTMVGVIAGLAVTLGVLLHLFVTRRLNVLLNATQGFAAGNLEVRAKLRGSDEVAILGRAFDRMAEQVTDTQRQLERLAYHDALTGLPNRALFMDRLEHALAQAGRHGWCLALLFVDLDRFKAINDTLGHAAGDALLQQIARRIERLLRAEDTVARLGGDEFVILLHGLSATHDAAHVASKAAAILAAPFEVDGHELHATVSIGISLFPKDGTDSTMLLKHADAALYQAKERGRNTYVYFNPD